LEIYAVADFSEKKFFKTRNILFTLIDYLLNKFLYENYKKNSSSVP
jgi:hypothetical protein